MSLINREALYEKACDLEAQALAYIGKIANDKTKIEEWKIWSAILIERTAFKHDIFDAPEVLPSAQPEPKWKRLMMHLADLQLTYSPNWGANGCGDQKLYEFVTGLIDELQGWEEGEQDA